jgi:hypothetical protein
MTTAFTWHCVPGFDEPSLWDEEFNQLSGKVALLGHKCE